MLKRLQDIHAGLTAITQECGSDMHEPDNQDVSAKVFGDHLDNAMGNHIGLDQIVRGYQEFVVVIKKGHKDEFRVNLADLIALARFANVGQ